MNSFGLRRFIGAFILLLLGAIAFPASVSAQDVIRFGASLSLTGGLSNEGKLVREGYDFYTKMINDRGGINVGGKKLKVEIKYYDDESNPQKAAELVER